MIWQQEVVNWTKLLFWGSNKALTLWCTNWFAFKLFVVLFSISTTSSQLNIQSMDPFLLPLWFVPHLRMYILLIDYKEAANFLRCLVKYMKKKKLHAHGRTHAYCEMRKVNQSILKSRDIEELAKITRKKMSKNPIDIVWHGLNLYIPLTKCFVCFLAIRAVYCFRFDAFPSFSFLLLSWRQIFQIGAHIWKRGCVCFVST